MTRIEPKVQAATGGATGAALVCWALTHWVWHGALPVPVEALVDVIVPGVTALAGGYLTPHQDRPGAPVRISPGSDTKQMAAELNEYLRRYYQRLSTPAAQQPQGDDSHWYATGGTITPSAAITSDPARPAGQPTENPTPKENTTMSLLTQFEALAEDLRGKVIGKVGQEVADEIHAAFDVFKGQGAQLLTQLGHDAQADATTVAADVAQVATDAASAVAPAPAEATPAQVATPTEVPAPASSPEPPAAPTA